jgi:hypothetical protein
MHRYRFGDPNQELLWWFLIPLICLIEWVIRPWIEKNKRGG